MKHTRRNVRNAKRPRIDITPESLRALYGLVTVARINARTVRS